MEDLNEYIRELSINKNYSENTIEAYKRDLNEYFSYLKKEEKSSKITNLQVYNLTSLKNTYVLKNDVFFAIMKI